MKGNAKTYDDGSKNEVPKLVKKSNSNKLQGKAKSKNKRNQDNEKRLFIGPSLPPECSNSASQGKVIHTIIVAEASKSHKGVLGFNITC